MVPFLPCISFGSTVTSASDSCKLRQSIGASHHTGIVAVLSGTESDHIWTRNRRLHVWAGATVAGVIDAGCGVSGCCTKTSPGAAVSSLTALSLAWSEEATLSLVDTWVIQRVAGLAHCVRICRLRLMMMVSWKDGIVNRLVLALATKISGWAVSGALEQITWPHV